MSWQGRTVLAADGRTGRPLALFHRHVDAEATAFAWTRTVDVEQQQWVGRRSGQQPSGEMTRNVQRRQETYWETVTDWQPGPANADGTPGAQQPLTRQELRTRTFYTYESLEWHESRTLSASGADRNEVRWPEYSLAPQERVRTKAETYTVTFTGPAKQYETTLDETQWRALALGTAYRLSLGLLGGVREVTPISGD
jgi:hypothetical protein